MNPPAKPSSKRGFTVVELLTAVAALVIVLGVMVQMARDVRGRNADVLTRRLLAQLDRTVAEYEELHPTLATVPPLVEPGARPYDENAIQQAAIDNNRAFVKAWQKYGYGKVLRELPLSVFDEKTGLLRDAWGTPIAFMPAGAPNVGIAPQARFFLISAGPDRRFTTLLDNLYSYEGPGRTETVTVGK